MILFNHLQRALCVIETPSTLFTLAPWPWPSEVLFILGDFYPRQTGQHCRDGLGEDLGEGQV